MSKKDNLEERLDNAWPVARWIHRKVIVAISGGPDSVALLHFLAVQHFHAEGTGKILAAHFNHRLRGAESDADEAFVREFCKKIRVELIVGHSDGAIETDKQRRGLEGSARDARYDFLRQTALAEGARYVAVAHTADDQAETILHHILRGTGLAGLRGMPRVRKLTEGVSLIRPWLSISRRDLRTYLHQVCQDFRTDSSNADLDRTRNRIRRELLPHLAQEYNPEVAAALVRLGQLAGEAQDTIEQLAEALASRAIAEASAEHMVLRCDVFSGAAPLVVRETLIQIWRQQVWSRDAMGLAEWEALAALVISPAIQATAKTFPGNIEAKRTGDSLMLTRRQ